MNRCDRTDNATCFTVSARKTGRRAALLQLLAGASALALPLAAHAGLRVFPMGTKFGAIDFASPPQVALNGQPARLGPGTRIHDAKNRLIFASKLRGQGFACGYLRDGSSAIREIWLLTPEEIQRHLPAGAQFELKLQTENGTRIQLK